MSTKKIFDDTYLYLKEVNNAYVKNSAPKNYAEISSEYWNLIYKNQ